LINVKRQVSSISAILMTRTINVWEYQRWTIQRNWQHIVYKTKKNKRKIQHNMCWTQL